MSAEKFSWQKRGRSFVYAFKGIRLFFQSEHNAILHGVATAAVIVAGVLVHITNLQWIAIIICIGIVWASELFNTAIEKLCDVVTPQQHPGIKFIKDVSAAAVLVVAFASVIVAAFIFIPYIL